MSSSLVCTLTSSLNHTIFSNNWDFKMPLSPPTPHPHPPDSTSFSKNRVQSCLYAWIPPFSFPTLYTTIFEKNIKAWQTSPTMEKCCHPIKILNLPSLRSTGGTIIPQIPPFWDKYLDPESHHLWGTHPHHGFSSYLIPGSHHLHNGKTWGAVILLHPDWTVQGK